MNTVSPGRNISQNVCPWIVSRRSQARCLCHFGAHCGTLLTVTIALRARPSGACSYFLVFGACLAAAALLFFCSLPLAFACFCEACLLVAFGDLSPIIRRFCVLETQVAMQKMRAAKSRSRPECSCDLQAANTGRWNPSRYRIHRPPHLRGTAAARNIYRILKSVFDFCEFRVICINEIILWLLTSGSRSGGGGACYCVVHQSFVRVQSAFSGGPRKPQIPECGNRRRRNAPLARL